MPCFGDMSFPPCLTYPILSDGSDIPNLTSLSAKHGGQDQEIATVGTPHSKLRRRSSARMKAWQESDWTGPYTNS
jgi:hypothetical protein